MLHIYRNIVQNNDVREKVAVTKKTQCFTKNVKFTCVLRLIEIVLQILIKTIKHNLTKLWFKNN